MPFTPYHFGPAACLALPLRKYLDPPVFILANVVVDLEPLIAMSFRLNYPLHGYAHTFMIGGLLGIAWALLAYAGRGILRRLMSLLHFPYTTSFRKIVISAVLGVWFHVLLDTPLYWDIRPFYPFQANPLYGLISGHTTYLICTLLFIPALILYGFGVFAYVRQRRSCRTAPP